MTTIELDAFSSYTLLNAGDSIIAFQQEPTESNWNSMNTAITLVLTNYSDVSPRGTNPQITVTMYDGTVAYWSLDRIKNTYANFLTKTISENRNTRVFAMTALLSTAGIGYGIFVSTIRTGNYTKVSTKYTRTGFSSIEPIGLVGCSLNTK